ncbi:tail protein X [Brucella intermedia]|uniref:Phage tail protein n=1 Tax=Brucella intermedia TaxID=94625 RepID=A0A7V6P9J7_9HYPH|nr:MULTISPECIES: tail protein X [Brucella/Ochrobactrum group]WGG61453.1 tail protein X [Brucella intermedia]HHV66798.1 phage tail protein [Brucella intermedia]
MQSVTVKGEGITLDLLLWRAYGVRGRILLEDTLALNVDVARLGTIIPMGTKVLLPDLPAETQGQSRDVISLFG